jgi:DNA mismatch endonuclease (patch repair protein)
LNDIFDPEKRKRVMQSIHSKDSKLEIMVYAYLRAHGVYYKKHYESAPGKPDIALPRKKRAVFIDSDFWHGWQYEDKVKYQLHSDYWHAKIEKTIARDIHNNNLLREQGWQVLRIWEHDLGKKGGREQVLNDLVIFLTN